MFEGVHKEVGELMRETDEDFARKFDSLVEKMPQEVKERLNSNTEFSVTAFGGKNSRKVKIELAEGDILIEIQKKLGENESFEVSTPNALMAVRGTTFSVSVHINEEGKHEIILNNAENEDVLSGTDKFPDTIRE